MDGSWRCSSVDRAGLPLGFTKASDKSLQINTNNGQPTSDHTTSTPRIPTVHLLTTNQA